MQWEVLVDRPSCVTRRSGRFLVADLRVPHLVLSTSVRNGGASGHVRYLLNHQSCEGSAHLDRHRVIHDHGLERYHDVVCHEAGVAPDATAMMGTAANMNYAAIVTLVDRAVEVTAVVTAGVEGNATCAGDRANWRQTEAGSEKVLYEGTINTMVLINVPVEPSVLARAVVTMTEGKSAALQRLSVPSRQSNDPATGTGTDQYCIAAAMAGGTTYTSASPHMKLGELIGAATRDATLEALRWQNGLEASYTRGVFHALGRFGLKEATFLEDIAARLTEDDLELLRRNSKAAMYEPLAGAAAHAFAAVFDRIRWGVLPAAVSGEALVQQAANLAVAIAAQSERWPEFRAKLAVVGADDPKQLALAAVALGWSEKWRAS
jgi:adenosylcobinamide amidohydrolase